VKSAVGQLEGYPVLSPELLGNDEGKRLTTEGMEGMDYPNLSLI
jgi:hypothetical protein